jgi:hypothetical protein
MAFVRKKRSETETCVKCGIKNKDELTWKRSRTALGERPLLCASCSKALSKDLKKFIENWLHNKNK